jgi:hypothetical protein
MVPGLGRRSDVFAAVEELPKASRADDVILHLSESPSTKCESRSSTSSVDERQSKSGN